MTTQTACVCVCVCQHEKLVLYTNFSVKIVRLAVAPTQTDEDYRIGKRENSSPHGQNLGFQQRDGIDLGEQEQPLRKTFRSLFPSQPC